MRSSFELEFQWIGQLDNLFHDKSHYCRIISNHSHFCSSTYPLPFYHFSRKQDNGLGKTPPMVCFFHTHLIFYRDGIPGITMVAISTKMWSNKLQMRLLQRDWQKLVTSMWMWMIVGPEVEMNKRDPFPIQKPFQVEWNLLLITFTKRDSCLDFIGNTEFFFCEF